MSQRDITEETMDLMELSNLSHMGLIGLAIILAGLIKIPKIEINIWNLIGRTIGRSINREAMQQVTDFSKDVKKQVDDLSKDFDAKIKELSQQVNDLEKADELERVRYARQRILRFNDEILCDQRHSKEHFDEVLDDITQYEHYCNTHEDYKNDKAVLAIKTIRKVYEECMETHDFLTPQKKEKKAS